MTTKKKRGIVAVEEEEDENSLMCANCCQPCILNEDTSKGSHQKKKKQESNCVKKILLDLNNKQGTKKKGKAKDVKKVLSTIYKLQVVNDLNLDGDTEKSSTDEIVLCTACGELLQTMYIIFDEFETLRKADSYLFRKIGQLDNLLKQLQETWTEMAAMTEVKTENDAQEEEKAEEEIMIVEEKKKVQPVVTNVKPIMIQDVKPQQQQSNSTTTATVSSSTIESDDLCSSLEQRILQEIRTITSVPSPNFNSHFDESNVEYEDESEDYIGVYNNPENEEAYSNVPHIHQPSGSSSSKVHSNTDDDVIELSDDDDDNSEGSDWGLQQSRKRKKIPQRHFTLNESNKYRVEYIEGCPLCPIPMTFEDPSVQYKHFESHHKNTGRGAVTCRFCSRTVSTFHNLRTHLRQHSRYYRFVCKVKSCEKSFLTQQKLTNHSCGAPEKPSSSSSTLPLINIQVRREAVSTTGIILPQVRPVAQSFTTTTNNQIIPEGRVVVYRDCPLCPPSDDSDVRPVYDKPSDLSLHLWENHRDSLSDLTCKICQHTFANSGVFYTHIKAHTADLRHVCEEPNCERKFLTIQHLQAHVEREHQFPNTQSHSTGSSSSSFSAPFNNLHRYKYKVQFFTYCPLCPKEKSTFPTPSDLSDHWLTHCRKDKPLCPLCQHKLVNTGSLRRHLRSHAFDRRYSCPVPECLGIRFSTNQHLQYHMTRRHGIQGDVSVLEPREEEIYQEEENEYMVHDPIDDEESIPAVFVEESDVKVDV